LFFGPTIVILRGRSFFDRVLPRSGNLILLGAGLPTPPPLP